MLLILALVLCAYFWPACPKMLKDNKQILLGVVVGLVLCTIFKKDLIEGWRTCNMQVGRPDDACNKWYSSRDTCSDCCTKNQKMGLIGEERGYCLRTSEPWRDGRDSKDTCGDVTCPNGTKGGTE